MCLERAGGGEPASQPLPPLERPKPLGVDWRRRKGWSELLSPTWGRKWPDGPLPLTSRTGGRRARTQGP